MHFIKIVSTDGFSEIDNGKDLIRIGAELQIFVVCALAFGNLKIIALGLNHGLRTPNEGSLLWASVVSGLSIAIKVHIF